MKTTIKKQKRSGLNILLILLLGFIIQSGITNVQAQAPSTLQFVQVKILTNGTLYTVPTGKVWKVESAVYSSYYISYTASARVIINGVNTELIPFAFYDGNGTDRAPYSTAFPMWLPAGTTIQPSMRTSHMFVIEFTVVPI